MGDFAVKSAIAEFLIHGLKYVLPVSPGRRVRGIPTGFAAAPLSGLFGIGSGEQDVPVWPDPEGEVVGFQEERG